MLYRVCDSTSRDTADFGAQGGIAFCINGYFGLTGYRHHYHKCMYGYPMNNPSSRT